MFTFIYHTTGYFPLCYQYIFICWIPVSINQQTPLYCKHWSYSYVLWMVLSHKLTCTWESNGEKEAHTTSATAHSIFCQCPKSDLQVNFKTVQNIFSQAVSPFLKFVRFAPRENILLYDIYAKSHHGAPLGTYSILYT